MTDADQIHEYIEKITKLYPDFAITDLHVFRTQRKVVDNSPYILELKVEQLSFASSELHDLILDAIKYGHAERECDAEASYRHDRSDDYHGEFKIYANFKFQKRIRLKLEIDRGCPVLSIVE